MLRPTHLRNHEIRWELLIARAGSLHVVVTGRSHDGWMFDGLRPGGARGPSAARTRKHRPPSGENAGVEANARLTASASVVLFVLLAIEGATVLSVRSLIVEHVFIGAVLVPPVAVKIASTMYRFARYYSGDPAYERKGPPPWLLRLIGPVVLVLTVALFASGIALLLTGAHRHPELLLVHKASFVAWFGVMTIHVLGHLRDSLTLGLPDWAGRGRRAAGATFRRGLLVASLALGAVGGAFLVSRVGPYLGAIGSRLGG